MFNWFHKWLKGLRRGGKSLDEAAQAVTVTAERAAELSRAQGAVLHVTKTVGDAFSIASEMGQRIGRLKASLPPSTSRNVIAFRSRVDFGSILDTSDELVILTDRALAAARISANQAREALSKSRVISIQTASAENLSATKAAEKTSRVIDEHISMLEKSKTRLENLHKELQALTNPTERDLPEVRRIVHAIEKEVAVIERKSAEVVGAAKESEVLSRGMTLPPGLHPGPKNNSEEEFQDWADRHPANIFGPIVSSKDRDAWIEPTVKSVIGAYQTFNSFMRSMTPAGDDGQGNYKLKAPVPMCFPQRSQVCEDPTPIQMPDDIGVWNKVGESSNAAAFAGTLVKP